MMAISMLTLLVLLSVILEVRCEELSRRRWLSKEGLTAAELATKSPTQLCLPEDRFYSYQPNAVAWIGKTVWLASILAVGLYLKSCSEIRSKPNEQGVLPAMESSAK